MVSATQKTRSGKAGNKLGSTERTSVKNNAICKKGA